MSQVVELFRRIRTMLKIFYVSGHHQFFHNSPGINFLTTGVAPFSYIGRGSIIWNWGGTFSKIINRGGHRGASHRSTWTGCFGKEKFQFLYLISCCNLMLSTSLMSLNAFLRMLSYLLQQKLCEFHFLFLFSHSFSYILCIPEVYTTQ